MSTSRKPSNVTKYPLIHLLMVIAVLPLCPRWVLALEEAPNGVGSKFLVLNDCDDDNNLSTAPYGDTVYMMDSDGQIVRIIARNLMVTKTCGGLSISKDGRFFVVCDRRTNTLASTR
jgi:hypothetical protein